MARRLFLLRVAVSAVIAAGALVANADAQTISTRAALDEGNEKILTATATTYQLDRSDLQVISRTAAALPGTRASVVRAKVLDRSTSRSYGVALDAVGRAVDLPAAQAAQRRVDQARYGTMTRELADVVTSSSVSKRIDVAFWLESDHAAAVTRDGIHRDIRATEVRSVEARTMRRVSAAVATVTRPFAADLRSQGYSVVLAAPYSPAVYARVPAGAVAALAADPRVQQVTFAGQRAQGAQNVVKTTTAANKVHASGFTGAPPALPGPPNVGVVECCDSLFEEDGTDNDAENNYWLARIHEGRSAPCPGDHSHPTAVSGIIGSTHPSLTGIAYNSNIYLNSAEDCGGDEAQLVAASQDVAANVNGATNHSYRFFTGGAEPCPGVTVAGTLARTLDDLVRLSGDSQYVAAANDGNGACVGAPATAWNVVAVGAWDDHNTNGWADDTMAGFSSGGDPASNDGDRNKPEVAGPGVNFTGLLPSPGGGPTGNIGSGTSYASPVYVGGAALAEEQRPFLAAWPETEKAVMLASSCHNVEGSQVNSDLDGAGGPDFGETKALLNANRFRGDSVPNGSGVAVTQLFAGITTGQEIRVGLAWDTNTSYGAYATDPADDLDLILRRPDGTIAATSATFDNASETIEFVADQAGTWKIEVNRFRTSDPAGFTFAGLAWHKYSPSACTAP